MSEEVVWAETKTKFERRVRCAVKLFGGGSLRYDHRGS